MDAYTREQVTALNAAMEARDVDAVMRLTGSDRFLAEFMISVGHGDIEGCLPSEREPHRPRTTEAKVIR